MLGNQHIKRHKTKTGSGCTTTNQSKNQPVQTHKALFSESCQHFPATLPRRGSFPASHLHPYRMMAEEAADLPFGEDSTRVGILVARHHLYSQSHKLGGVECPGMEQQGWTAVNHPSSTCQSLNIQESYMFLSLIALYLPSVYCVVFCCSLVSTGVSDALRSFEQTWVQPTCRRQPLSLKRAGPVHSWFSTSWFFCPADASNWSGKSAQQDGKHYNKIITCIILKCDSGSLPVQHKKKETGMNRN